jgi:hypothetical protein
MTSEQVANGCHVKYLLETIKSYDNFVKSQPISMISSPLDARDEYDSIDI